MATQETSLRLESRVLGAILLRGESYFELPAAFRTEAFQREEFRRAFGALERWAKAKRLGSGPVDVALLTSDAGLRDETLLRIAEAEADTLDNRATLAENAGALIEKHRRGELARVLSTAAAGLDGKAPVEEITGKVLAALLDLDAGEAPEVKTTRDTYLALIDELEAVKTGKARAVKTGFADLDRVLKMRPGNLIVIGARPGNGKTTFARQIARAIAGRGEHVLEHSLEMTDVEQATLDLSAEAQIDSQRFFDDSGFSSEEWNRVTAAAERGCAGGDGFLHTNDSYHSLGALCRITEKWHRRVGLALVIVDYLQLVQIDLGRGSNREREVATISRTLKLLAMRLGVPFLVLSQLNRAPEKRSETNAQPKCAECGKAQGKHFGEAHAFQKPPLPAPKLHDLRESGSIEQDANAVCFLHNPYAESDDATQRQCGPFELVIAKQRLGKKGRARFVADLKHSKFRPYVESRVAYAGGFTEGEDR